MIITECNHTKRINKDNLIPTVLNHIYAICKEDKHFKIKDETILIEGKLSLVNSKLKKQNVLLEQSNVIKSELLEKIRYIKDESFKLKYKILETLGSDI